MKNGIGKTLRTLRQAAGLTQKQLGDALFVSARTIGDWESDHTEPSIFMIKKLITFFNITYEELLDSENIG